MAKLNIDEMLGEIGAKYKQLEHVEGMQHAPDKMTTTNFKQEYTIVIRKKKYYAVTALEGNEKYERVYQINNFNSINTTIATSGGPGTCNISIVGNTKIICAEREQQDKHNWSSFNEMLNSWSYEHDDNETLLDSDGNYIINDRLFDNIDDMKKIKYGWRIAEKCDFEPMDEVYIYGKSRREKEGNKYKMYQIFFGYISDVKKAFYAGKQNPMVSITATDHTKLLQVSYVANTPALNYQTAVAGAHYDTDFAGNIIVDDNPVSDGPETEASPFTNIFAGRYPYEIIIKCAKEAGIPESYLEKRIERIKRIPFMPQIKDNPVEVFQSDVTNRLNFCQQAAEALFTEFFADEEGNLVLKIPNYTLGINEQPANNAYIDKYMTTEEKEAAKNTGVRERTYQKEVISYETISEVITQSVTHTVVYGDTLWDLAYSYLGDSMRWPEIYEVNKNKIRDPHWIYPGQVLTIKQGKSVSKQVEKKSYETVTEMVDGGALSTITDKYIPLIKDDEVISFVLSDSDNQIVNCFEISPQVPLIQSSIEGAQLPIKRVVQDWSSIIRFGMRQPKSISTPLLDGEVGPVVFGTLMIQRSLSQRYKGTLTMIEDSSIKVGNPIRVFTYDEHPYIEQENQKQYGNAQSVFYVERIERSIKPDGASTMTLTLSAGRMMGMDSIYDKLSILYGRYFEEYSTISSDREQIYSPGKGNNSGKGNSTALQDQIIEYAKQFLGAEYVWGGKGPDVFDCSGYVSYVFRNFGIKLTSYTHDMKNEGREVSYNDIQPCDIVFFNNFEHVGMAISKDQFIHASQPGDVVKISPLSSGWGRDNLCMVMRVL